MLRFAQHDVFQTMSDQNNPTLTPTPSPSPRPHRLRRWLLRLVLTLAILVALFLLAVQVVLWTDLPRKWVLSAIQQNLQLRVSAGSFNSGWRGRTSLDNVNLSLPLADQSFLQTPRLAIRHTSLWALLLGRGLKVESIEIDKPEVLVLQGADGRWNVQEVAELLRRATGGKTAEGQPQSAGRTGIPHLPRVNITDGVIRVVNRYGRHATIQPLSIQGWSDGPLVWRFEAKVPDRLQVTGEVAPGGPWAHQAEIRLLDLGPLAEPFIQSPTPAIRDALRSMRMDARWDGRADGGVWGRLNLRNFFAAGWKAAGPIRADFGRDAAAVRISPAGLEITPPITTIPPARAAGGTLTFADGALAAQALSFAFAGGEVRIGGSYAFDRRAGKAEIWWNKLILPAGTVHGGSLEASLRQPWPGQPVFAATLTSDGQLGADQSWSGQITLSGSGTSWQNIDWRIDTPRLVYHHQKEPVDLSHLTATLSTRGNVVALTSLSIPPGGLYGKYRRGTLTGEGQYDLATRDWNAHIAGADWPLKPGDDQPAGKTDVDLDFDLTAQGGRTWIQLRELFVSAAGVQAWANGQILHLPSGGPTDLHIYVGYPPVNYTWRERRAGATSADDVHLSGHLYSELHLTGALWPLDLDVNGSLYARQFKVNEHPLGNVTMYLAGFADPRRLHLTTSDLELLGGTWDATLVHHYPTRLTELTHLTVDLKQLPLAQVDNFVKPPPSFRGVMAGRWALQTRDFDLKGMSLDGSFDIRRLARVASMDPPATQAATTRPETVRRVTPGERLIPIADRVEGNITARKRIVTIAPIRFHHTAGRGATPVRGEGTALVRFPLDAPSQVHLEGTLASWPLMLADPKTGRTGEAILWGETSLDVDLKQLAGQGRANATLSLAWNNQTVGSLKFDTLLDRRIIHVKSIGGDILGGSVIGGGSINLEKPLESNGRFDWNHIEAPRIINLFPALAGLQGNYSGTTTFSPTPRDRHPNALGPFGITGSISVDGGWLHGMHVGNAQFTAYLDKDRAVLDRLRWNLADGQLGAWARLTWYKSPTTKRPERFLHVGLDVDKLSLDQVLSALRPRGVEHEAMPGLVTGRLWAAGNPFTEQGRRLASGEGNLRIERSDLANADIVNALYSIMSVRMGDKAPEGRGFAELRLEGPRLEIPVVRYFNRGVDLWINASVLDVFQGPGSAIQGTAAGSARPLRDLKLPFAADIDKIFQALQSNLATVAIGGTVKKPEAKVIPFAEAGSSFRRFMVGEVQSETRGTAGR